MVLGSLAATRGSLSILDRRFLVLLGKFRTLHVEFLYIRENSTSELS